jgi:CRP-like cAMP-binding protein|tara:strand:+ start:5542 stop:6090 length:549 start_codon:yes stop_codon:yes gene_type:complete
MKNVLYILGKLSDDDIEWLINNGSGERYHPGDVLIEEGVIPENIYLILEGIFDVISKAINNESIAKIGQGEIVGEMSFVEPYPPYASVVTDEESFILVINREKLKEKIEHDSGFASRFYFAIAVMLADRLRTSVQTIKIAHKKHAEGNDKILAPDELDLDSLHDFSQAGTRFDRIVKRVKGV